MKTYVIYCVAAAIIAWIFSFIITPLVRIFAYGIGALDIPRDARRVHKKAMPLLGGLAIWFGFTVTSILFCGLSIESIAMWCGGTLIVITGIIDDRFDIPAMLKFLIQIAIATATVLVGNIVISEITIFGNTIVFGNFWDTIISVIWMVALINAINLIDGLDGLACGVSCIGALSILIIAIIYSNSYMALFASILIGSCAGFLPYNFNPAKIFMGDTGSMFLGYILSIMSIKGSMSMNSLLAFVTPIAVFGLPLLDTAFAFIRRILQGRSPFSADRGHLHHRLIDIGFTHKQTVCIMYLISAMLGMSAIIFSLRNLDESLDVFTNRRLMFCACGTLAAGILVFVCEFLVFHNSHLRRHSGLGLPVSENEDDKKQISPQNHQHNNDNHTDKNS